MAPLTVSESMRRAIRKYQNSEKGKETRKEYLKRYRLENPDYLKTYLERRRKIAVETGMCVRCLVNVIYEGRALCYDCTQYNRRGKHEIKIEKEKEQDACKTYM